MTGRTRAILTDIEGTTSSIAFVTETLFPYARARIPDYVEQHWLELGPLLANVPGEASAEKVATLLHWIDQDAKETALKTLQGMVWEEGFADGSLAGHVYPDAAAALRRWHADGIALYVYSSGSVTAQQLVFQHSSEGNLRPLFSGWFDTHIGPKREPLSYVRIASRIGLPMTDILFLSDSTVEVEAARGVDMRAILVDREGGQGDVASFDAIDL